MGPVTLLHGDAHIGNTYLLPDDDVGFLDWEVVRRGNWSHDAAYFLIGSLTEDDRRVQVDLVDVYLAALEAPTDQRPSREEAWLRYRASRRTGLAYGRRRSYDGWQRREVCLAVAQRFAVAFVELDTLGALDELERGGDAGPVAKWNAGVTNRYQLAEVVESAPMATPETPAAPSRRGLPSCSVTACPTPATIPDAVVRVGGVAREHGYSRGWL